MALSTKPRFTGIRSWTKTRMPRREVPTVSDLLGWAYLVTGWVLVALFLAVFVATTLDDRRYQRIVENSQADTARVDALERRALADK